jgi:hypothetical protein
MSDILTKAKELSANAKYERGGQGEITGTDSRPAYDCSGLVIDTLNKLGNNIPDMSAGNMKNSGYFDIIPIDQFRPGDIFVTQNANGGWHSAFIEWYDGIIGSGEFYGAQSSGIGKASFGTNAHYWKKPFCILRPKSNLSPQPNRLLTDWPSESRFIPRRDPLLLDLDRNGIKTIGTTAGIHFDYDGNGLKELTGWVAHGDGLLMLDRDENGFLDKGSELFGDFTPLKNGLLAVNGFQALAQFDANGDGKIDPEDPIWSELRAWQHDPEATDISDPDISGVFRTLPELGIKAVYLDSTPANETDASGNTALRAGHFEWEDGAIGMISEYRFQRDPRVTISTPFLPVPQEVESLPDLRGYGNICNLHQAIVRDESGQLKALVEDFTLEQDPAQRGLILEQILFRWTGTEGVVPNSRGPFMDARRLSALEKLYGERRANPNENLAAWWEGTYRQISEMFYGSLMAQTHLRDIFGLITYTYDEGLQRTRGDLSNVITELQTRLNGDPLKGKQTLSEFVRAVRGVGIQEKFDYLSFREIFIQQDPDLGWIIDSAGLIERVVTSSSSILSNDSDAARLDPGAGTALGRDGNDALYGNDGADSLFGENGDDLVVAGGGNDYVTGGAGNDLLEGGLGDDRLYGEAGNDVYLFRRGDERNRIEDADFTAGNQDTLRFGNDILPADVMVRRKGDDLVLTIENTQDMATIGNYFRDDSTLNLIEQIQFADGTLWGVEAIKQRVLQGHFVDRPLNMERVAAECDLGILNGTHTTTANLLMAGKPTLHFPMYLEQTLTACRIEQLGVGLSAAALAPQALDEKLKLMLGSASCGKKAHTYSELCRNSAWRKERLMELVQSTLDGDGEWNLCWLAPIDTGSMPQRESIGRF